jgi:hypothetical protein
MTTYTKAAITGLLAAASGACIAFASAAGPLPISTTMETAATAAAVEVRWSARRGWGPRAPIDGAIIGGPIAANAFGPYGYGYPYYPSYSCYGFWLFEECYSRFHWSYRR